MFATLIMMAVTGLFDPYQAPAAFYSRGAGCGHQDIYPGNPEGINADDLAASYRF